MSVVIPVSVGELFDKITILEIKMHHLSSLKKKAHAMKELELLNKHAGRFNLKPGSRNALKSTNQALWDAEDKIREKEKYACFDGEFIELARSIYRLNDQRARIKLDINIALDSNIVEVKSYV